jgi:hypothetical protein
MIRLLCSIAVCLSMLTMCRTEEPVIEALVPTQTLLPTMVQSSPSDEQAAITVVHEFQTAMRQRNELVALLLLSPAAQQRVAASDLRVFAPTDWQARTLDRCSALVQGNVATVVCGLRPADDRAEVHVSMLRLHEVWKIDDLREP